jgi:hypothetical protein
MKLVNNNTEAIQVLTLAVPVSRHRHTQYESLWEASLPKKSPGKESLGTNRVRIKQKSRPAQSRPTCTVPALPYPPTCSTSSVYTTYLNVLPSLRLNIVPSLLWYVEMVE